MSKLRFLALCLILGIFFFSMLGTSAQIGGIAPNPTRVPDTDGDGVIDTEDNCPDIPGTVDNRGCPPPSNPDPCANGATTPSCNTPPPPNPDPCTSGSSAPNCPPPPPNPDPCARGSSAANCPPPPNPDPCANAAGTPSCDTPPPPYQPPSLPTDACYIAAAGRDNVNVRSGMSLTHEILGVIQSGQIYEAEHLVAEDGSHWFELISAFVLADAANAGKTGYVAATVVVWGNCPIQEDDGVSRPNTGDFTSADLPLCHMTVGFDAGTWSTYPEMPNVTYGAIWFAVEPGMEIEEGTKAWGVIFLKDFISLPDSENIFAFATDPAIYDAAVNADYAGDYNWPTLAGGVESGDTKLYRLMDDVGAPNDGTGRCGPIVAAGIDDVVAPEPANDNQQIQRPINDFACTIHVGVGTYWMGTFAFNAAPTTPIPVGTSPIAVISVMYQPDGIDEVNDADYWTAELMDGENYILSGLLKFTLTEDFIATIHRLHGVHGGTCGPIVDATLDAQRVEIPSATPEPSANDGASTHAGGVNVLLSDGSVRVVFVGGWGSSMYQYAYNDPNLGDECEEGWVYDIYSGDRSEVFYCAPNGYANDNQNSASAPDNVFEFECPEGWFVDIYETSRNEIFTCTPPSLTADGQNSNAAPEGGFGLECPEGWVLDIYENELNPIFYCMPLVLTANGQSSPLADDVIVDGRIITAENFGGIGFECPEDWVYDIYAGDRNPVFYCSPTDLMPNDSNDTAGN